MAHAIPSLVAVGDVVTVGRSCMGNPPGARAVVVEVLDIEPTLLFPNGASDSFSPSDVAVLQIVRVGHEPSIEGYDLVDAFALYADWRAGRFADVWRKVGQA